jgi:hypothetical protein
MCADDNAGRVYGRPFFGRLFGSSPSITPGERRAIYGLSPYEMEERPDLAPSVASVVVNPPLVDRAPTSNIPQDYGDRASVALTGQNFRPGDSGHLVATGFAPPAGYGPFESELPTVRRTPPGIEPPIITPGSILDPQPPTLMGRPDLYTPGTAAILVTQPPSRYYVGEQGPRETGTNRVTQVEGDLIKPSLLKQVLIVGGLGAGVEWATGDPHALVTGGFGAGSTAVANYLCPGLYRPLVSGALAAGGHTLYGSPRGFLYLFLLQAGSDWVAQTAVEKPDLYADRVAQRVAV